MEAEQELSAANLVIYHICTSDILLELFWLFCVLEEHSNSQ